MNYKILNYDWIRTSLIMIGLEHLYYDMLRISSVTIDSAPNYDWISTSQLWLD